MWPWRRSPSPDAAPRPAPVPPAGTPAPFARPPGSRGDWQLIAPIQRVTTEPELINPVSRFQDALTAWQNPSFTGPLGHRLGADEPSGVITDLAAARTGAAPVHAEAGAPMPLAVLPAPPKTRPAVQRLAGAAGPAPDATHLDAPVAAEPVPAAAAPDPGLPVLTLPTVGVVGDLPATAGAAPDEPADTAPTLGEPPTGRLSGPDDGDAVPAGAAPPGPAMPVASPPPPAAPPALTVARIADAPAAGVSGPPPAAPAPRRIGLGEPIIGPRPAAPAVQRLPLAAPPPLSSPNGDTPADAPLLGARSPLNDDPAGPAGAGAVTAAASGNGTAPAPVPVLAPDTVSRYPVLAPPAPAAPAAATARPVVARLVGDAPPLVAPHRAADAGAVDAGGAYPGAPGAPGPVAAPTGGGVLSPAVPVSRIVEPAVTPPRPAPTAPMVYAGGASAQAPAVQRSSGSGATGGNTVASLPLATASWVHPEVVQRIETVREVPVPQVVTVQREEAGGAAAASPGESTPPASAPAAGGGGDTESMLAKLFDPLLAKIKTELRLDRERRGTLTDLWH